MDSFTVQKQDFRSFSIALSRIAGLDTPDPDQILLTLWQNAVPNVRSF